jgi:hypothetical protein
VLVPTSPTAPAVSGAGSPEDLVPLIAADGKRVAVREESCSAQRIPCWRLLDATAGARVVGRIVAAAPTLVRAGYRLTQAQPTPWDRSESGATLTPMRLVAIVHERELWLRRVGPGPVLARSPLPALLDEYPASIAGT